MIKCQNCNQAYPSEQDHCLSCGFIPQEIDGFTAWAPQLAHGGGGFKAEYFKVLAKLEAQNFWFRSRNKLINWALEKYFPNFTSCLEIGCGTGFVLSNIAKVFPASRLVGSEIFTAGLSFASQRIPQASFLQMDARNLPYENEFDVIGIFDDLTVLNLRLPQLPCSLFKIIFQLSNAIVYLILY